MQISTIKRKLFQSGQGKLAAFWTGLGVLGGLAVMPYAFALNPSLLDQVPIPLPLLIFVQLLQMAILLGICTYIGLSLGANLGLDSPLARAFIKGKKPALAPKNLVLALLAGVLTGILIIALDALWQPLLPVPHQASLPDIAPWKAFLAAFYGGITEELLLRLFLMTFIAWLLSKIFARGKTQTAAWIFWTAIILAAVLFGLGHLPAVAQIWDLTSLVVLRTLSLNVMAGLVFGFLYWRWGLEYAMLAHFITDIVLHVIGWKLKC